MGAGTPQPAKVQEAGWGPAAPRSLRGVRGHKTYSLRNLERNKAQAGNAYGVTATSPPAAPAHPTGGGGTFCVRLGMYVSPRVKILGAGDQGFSLISFTGLPANVSPQPFASGLR